MSTVAKLPQGYQIRWRQYFLCQHNKSYVPGKFGAFVQTVTQFLLSRHTSSTESIYNFLSVNVSSDDPDRARVFLGGARNYFGSRGDAQPRSLE